MAPLEHQLFGRVPLVRDLLSNAVETDGGHFTVNRGGFYGAGGESPFAHTHGAGFRAVYDLSDLDNSRFVIATGQSGHPLSPHWGDMVETWASGGHFPGRRRSVRARRRWRPDTDAATEELAGLQQPDRPVRAS